MTHLPLQEVCVNQPHEGVVKEDPESMIPFGFRKSLTVLFCLRLLGPLDRCASFFDFASNFPEFSVATSSPSCDSYPVASEEECEIACKSVNGNFQYSAGEWEHWPGCFVYNKMQNCHWNRNGTAQLWPGRDHWNICVKTGIFYDLQVK